MKAEEKGSPDAMFVNREMRQEKRSEPMKAAVVSREQSVTKGHRNVGNTSVFATASRVQVSNGRGSSNWQAGARHHHHRRAAGLR